MEIFVISFLLFVVVSGGLAIGLLFGHGPMHAGCRPDGAKGSCAEEGNCVLRCTKRHGQQTIRETSDVG